MGKSFRMGQLMISKDIDHNHSINMAYHTHTHNDYDEYENNHYATIIRSCAFYKNGSMAYGILHINRWIYRMVI